MEYLVQDKSLTAIADAIRAKSSSADKLTLAQMPEKITALQTGTDMAAIILQYGTLNVSPMELSGYTSAIKAEEFNYGNLLIGPIKLTEED